MSAHDQALVHCAGVSFHWPDGTVVLRDLDWTVPAGRTGVIGPNGTGKSTLLELIAGELAPRSGSVRTSGELGYLPQRLTFGRTARVDDVLGIRARRTALRAIERGDTEEEHFAVLNEEWDVEERCAKALGELGLGHLGLDRGLDGLSGGELVLLHLAALLLRRPDVLLLDEPTNNLDRRARHLLYEAIRSYDGALIVASHDRELLELVDRIAELREATVHGYGGNLAHYEAAVAAEREAAERSLRTAESEVKRQRDDLTQARVKLDKRRARDERTSSGNREPRVLTGQRKRDAQLSAGKHRILHEQRLDQARRRLAEARERFRDEEDIRVDLPATAVPNGRRVLSMRHAELCNGVRIPELRLRGPERVALSGPNGGGKSTLLHTVAGLLSAEHGTAETAVPLRYLPQRHEVLDERLSLAENVARLAPEATNNEIRARLARFLFRQRRADQPVRTLSGGERVRAALAGLLLAEPAPQLLLLDEPTNNLDMAGTRRLAESLAHYEGALLVVSHDVSFLRELNITRWLWLAEELTETDPERP
ncbi:ATPase components of ABC transporters with duplicated ATPase domains [Actinopolyspora xinjiangensis]|uniref:ATPase components of ABC transporters with duplicated ATPase domains n=1 Tax=Actinopolyspora xinjiangensis TaxID=405564 RepID=A0A1H0RQD1_9ACTN|nr:ATP-binding cassette domain-containing protein [Actinopolyspora xinjiangensis]SDP31673.1 ATPase components of ABC transporters with duplicated ATPase domains [Actinopolyspora xinjiangensis]